MGCKPGSSEQKSRRRSLVALGESSGEGGAEAVGSPLERQGWGGLSKVNLAEKQGAQGAQATVRRGIMVTAIY